MTTREEEEHGTVFVLGLVTGFAIGRWWGKRVEREDLFRIISALRITHAQEQ